MRSTRSTPTLNTATEPSDTDPTPPGDRATRWAGFAGRYLKTPRLSAGAAAAFLRSAFVLAFLAQCVVAALVGVVVVLLAGGAPSNPSSLLAWTLAAFALAQLPVVALVVTRLSGLPGGKGARRSALSAALMAGVLLASTAWFLSLALATGQTGIPLFLLLFLTLTGYGLGFLVVGRLGRVAASELIGDPEEGAGPEEEAP